MFQADVEPYTKPADEELNKVHQNKGKQWLVGLWNHKPLDPYIADTKLVDQPDTMSVTKLSGEADTSQWS